jgi:hypothetical protein
MTIDLLREATRAPVDERESVRLVLVAWRSHAHLVAPDVVAMVTNRRARALR